MLNGIKYKANYQPPFDMLMTERSYTGNGLRFGFNTQEKDKELFEAAYCPEFMEYDGRFLSKIVSQIP